MNDTQITLPDGRTLTYTDIGDSEGTCVMHFHGAPASRYLLDFYDEECKAHGLRVVSPDRPGYGGSSPQPGRSMADWPGDVGALADVLGIDRFVAMGSSSGGPYTVACCALLPDRVLGGLVIAGATDMSWSPASDGYPEVELDIMDLDSEAEAIAYCRDRFGADGSGFFEEDPLPWPEPDAAFLADEEMSEHLSRAMEEAFAQGVTGYAQDMVIQGRPWPFDPAAIECPVRVLHGERDDITPMAHSRHTAAVIPDAEFEIVPHHGHASIMDDIPRLTAAFVSQVV